MVNQEQEINNLKEKIRELESVIQKLKEENNNQINELNDLLIQRNGIIVRTELEKKDEIRELESQLESGAKWMIILNQRLDAANKEKKEAEKRAQNAEAEVKEQKITVKQLRNTINELEREKNSQQIANYFGFTSVYSAIRNSFIISIITFIFLIILVQIWKIISKGKKKVVKNS
jgi:DNA repair exonuclease SbcCD ATPase subunit